MTCYYKVCQTLQSVTDCYYSVSGITKCDRLYYKVHQVLQYVTVIAKWDISVAKESFDVKK